MIITRKAQKVDTKDIRINSIQVWSNQDNELIMSVADGGGVYHVISLKGCQRLLQPTFTELELVDHLNTFGYARRRAELTVEE